MRLPTALIVLTALAACAPASDDGAAPTASASLQRGEVLSFACQACHSLAAGGEHQVGPNLNGVFGRVAGSAEGFSYSDVLRAADFVWTAAELDAWLRDPAGFLPGTTMAFTGYQVAADRAALIEFLQTATQP